MKTTILLILCVAMLTGCASVRKPMGHAMTNAGQHVGKNGMVIMVVGAFNPLTWPLVPVGISIMVIALPLYYGGCLVAGEKPEREPFNM